MWAAINSPAQGNGYLCSYFGIILHKLNIWSNLVQQKILTFYGQTLKYPFFKLYPNNPLQYSILQKGIAVNSENLWVSDKHFSVFTKSLLWRKEKKKNFFLSEDTCSKRIATCKFIYPLEKKWSHGTPRNMLITKKHKFLIYVIELSHNDPLYR